MKEHDLLDAVGGINEKYINNAGKIKTQRRGGSYIKWGMIAAACLCMIVVAGITIPNLLHSPSDSEQGPQPESNEAVVDNQDNKQNNPDVSIAEGVYIPAIELPESSDIESAEMVGLVVYKGHIYTQAEDYLGEEAQRIESLVGEHLGTAKGNIDEWSSQDEYATEFASNISGEVYSVNGYDTSFRICIMAEVEDENHNPTTWIQFLDCMNDITLTTGQDLFEDRLHIRERTEVVQWQSHSDWDYAGGNFQTAEIGADTWEEFWNQVDTGEFINTRNPDNNRTDPTSNNTSIYDTQNQAHLILTMNDGTVVRLRLIEGGYVGYDALGWYFVRIPEDVFNTVYEMCGGTH